MFSINNTYYNESIRKMVTAFGALFNSIYILRRNDAKEVVEKIRVPLIYGPKEKFIYRIKTEAQITDNTHVQITLPMIGFDMTSIIYDTSRKTNRLNRRIVGDRSTYSEVPYNINFGLYVFCRNIDDNLQIIEQILPNFTPEFNVSLNLNELNTKVTVPIILNGVNTEEIYEGDFQTRRSITTSFDFTAKTYLYGQIKEESNTLINEAEVNLYDGLTASVDYFIETFSVIGAT